MANILIVEDDANIRLLLEARLKSRYTVFTADGAKEALKIIENTRTDLIITDIMMPETDGFELVRKLRSRGNDSPVIMLTAKDTFADKGKGFSVGCDDYLTKPVNFQELIWRIDALLRRCKIANEGKITIGEVTVDANSYTVTRGESVSVLPVKEFQLLFLLLSYPDKIFTKEQILDDVWGYESESGETTVRTHVNRLRNRFENYPEFEIVTIRGMGYKAVIKNDKK